VTEWKLNWELVEPTLSWSILCCNAVIIMGTELLGAVNFLKGVSFFYGSTAIAGLGFLIVKILRSHWDAPHLVCTPPNKWLDSRRDLYLTTHTLTRDVHAPGEIRTHNPSMRAAADPRLRPCSCWDGQMKVDSWDYALPFTSDFTEDIDLVHQLLQDT